MFASLGAVNQCTVAKVSLKFAVVARSVTSCVLTVVRRFAFVSCMQIQINVLSRFFGQGPSVIARGLPMIVAFVAGMRPLHYASWQGVEEPVAILLQWRSSANLPAHNGETPLHLAAQHGHYEVVSTASAVQASIVVLFACGSLGALLGVVH